jgi:hypothetical protein
LTKSGGVCEHGSHVGINRADCSDPAGLSIRSINEHGRMNWRKTSGSIVQVKTHVASEVKIAVKALNRMLELGRPIRVRIA